MGYPNETELLHALATLREQAHGWLDEAAALRAEIDTTFIRAGETEWAARLNRQASHLEYRAAIVLGAAGATAAGADSPADIPAPLLMAAMWTLANSWRGQAQECDVSPGARRMLRDHAGAVDELLRWAAQEARCSQTRT